MINVSFKNYIINYVIEITRCSRLKLTNQSSPLTNKKLSWFTLSIN